MGLLPWLNSLISCSPCACPFPFQLTTVKELPFTGLHTKGPFPRQASPSLSSPSPVKSLPKHVTFPCQEPSSPTHMPPAGNSFPSGSLPQPGSLHNSEPTASLQIEAHFPRLASFPGRPSSSTVVPLPQPNPLPSLFPSPCARPFPIPSPA